MNVFILGTTPTNLMVRQNGVGTVLVFWTAPSPPPSMGYRITTDTIDFSAGIDVTSFATSRIIPLHPGVHSIRMRTNSQHYPSEIVGPVEVTVKGTFILLHIQHFSLWYIIIQTSQHQLSPHHQ